ADGSLRQNDQLVGAIGLYDFDPGDNFVRYGNSGIVPARTPEPVTDRSNVGVAQGFLEESNVNPVLEMTRLIMVQRAFENTAALIRQSASSTDDAIKTLGSK
ncbi:flagellar basal body rod C-terminal domain-containing protein, partial [Mesorhizobium sp. M1E.F.Ca.ET.063.01.1.1]